MFRRQSSGSVVCPSCGRLVGVRDPACYNCGHRNPALWGFAPALRRLGNDLGFVKLLIGGSAALFVAALLLDPAAIGFGASPFSFLSPSMPSLFLLGASGAVPVFEYGRWWSLLSAGWLHGSLLHILFNVLWVRQLAPAVAEVYGAGRMVLLYTISSVVGFLTSSLAGHYLFFMPRFLQGAGFTVGASAAIFGLLGALLFYSRRSGASLMGQQLWSWALVMFVFGFLSPGVDNFAHAGGFAGGWIAAQVFDPLRPERPSHVLAAVATLVATVAAVAISLWHGFSFVS